MGITVGAHYFKDTIAEFENGNIKSTATEVEDGDFFVFFGFETVGESCSGRLVNNSFDFETGDFASILGSLALRIVEVGRNGDDGFGKL